MEDIIIDDRRQLSAKAVSREQEEIRSKRRKRSLRQYLTDFLLSSLLAAIFVGIDFTLFAGAGSYSMFTPAQNLTPETFYILAAIFASALIISWLFSFSRWAQNMVPAAAFGFLIFAVFNQFALFDRGSFLASSFGALFNANLAAVFITSSHIITAVFAAVALWIFLLRSRRSTMAYFTGIVLLSWAGLLSESYFNPISRNFKTAYEPYKTAATAPAKTDTAKRFIYLAFPGLGSYNGLDDLISVKSGQRDYNQTIQTAKDSMLGFYANNNFNFYPHAYVDQNNPFLNLTETFNPVNFSKDPADYTLNNVLLKSFWDFNNIADSKIYLKDNKLFDSFRKNNYQLKVYQSRGIETCSVNNELAVSKCVAKANLPMNFNGTSFTTLQKSALLGAQWLESAGLVEDFSSLTPLFKLIASGNNIPAINFNPSKLYVANAFQTLDLILRDIDNESSDAAYFAIIDLPSDLYIYDSYCKLKPMADWIGSGATKDLSAQKQAYAEQTACLFGQLENFIQQLAAAGKLDSSVIVLQGLDTPKFGAIQPTDTFERIKAAQTVTMAIYDPLQTNYAIHDEICLAPAILKSYLYKKVSCRPFENLPMVPVMQKEISSKFAAEKISDAEITAAINNFITLYGGWAKTNKVSNSLTTAVLPVQPQPEPVAEIKNIPATPAVEELPPETRNETIATAAQKTVLSEANNQEAVTKPIVQPSEEETPTPEKQSSAAETPADEILKIDSSVELKIKVIDHEEPLPSQPQPDDVIPPFVADLPVSHNSSANAEEKPSAGKTAEQLENEK